MKTTTILLLSSLLITKVIGQKFTFEDKIKCQNIEKSNTEGEQILNGLLKSFSYHADSVIKYFHKDVIIEFPYAASIGTAEYLNNNDYYNYLKGALPNMPNIRFTNIKVYPTIDNAYWAEANGESMIASTGNIYRQKYVIYFVLKDGKICLYREYWDPIAGQKAFGQEKKLNEIFNKNQK